VGLWLFRFSAASCKPRSINTINPSRRCLYGQKQSEKKARSDKVKKELEKADEDLEDEDEFDPKNVEDGRRKMMRSIVLRRGQSKFRKKVIAAYAGNCCISGCTFERVLDAAHIVPYMGSDTDYVSNALLLRTDLHTLFDLGEIGVDTKGMTLLVSADLDGTDYEELRGVKLRLPSKTKLQPSKVALDDHRVLNSL
jgi:putative restriction endonuclease